MSRRLLLLLVAGVIACSEVQTPPEPNAGGGGMGGAGGEAPPACPEVPATWPMVAVPDSLGGYFCIDSREVTNEQYAAFLATNASPALHPQCAGITDFTPKALWPPAPERMQYPVVAITWCQAQAFCLANGKRLCGEEGTGLVREYEDGLVPGEWQMAGEMYLACSQGGSSSYPYGNELEPGRCNDSTGEAVPADLETACEGGYAGIYFLYGNVFEWEGACNFIKGDNHSQTCSMRGMYLNGNGCLSTGAPSINGEGVNDWSHFLGVRCCADTLPP